MSTNIKVTLVAVLAGASIAAVLHGTPASAEPVSGQGPITDVIGTWRLVKADGTATPFSIAGNELGPDGTGIRLKRGERVEVIGRGSSCLNPNTQQRHNADEDPVLGGHFAECHDDGAPEGVPASWAR